jgi:hypothetical protein
MRTGLGFLDDGGGLFYSYDAEFFGVGDYGGGGLFDSSDYDYFFGGGGGDIGGGIFDQSDYDYFYGGGTDLYLDYLNYYLGQGYDDNTAAQYAQEDTQGPAFQIEGEGRLPETQLPTFGGSFFYPLPYVETQPFDYQLPEGEYYGLPPGPSGPCNGSAVPTCPAGQQNNPANQCECIPVLPGPCPAGQYHPYPAGHAQQNICVPFPAQQTQQQQQKQQTGGGRSSSGGGGSKQQPQPQQCPAPYVRDPLTGQCKLPPCPTGYKRDPWTLQCVRQTQQQQQQQQCPTGYYLDPASRTCKPMPTCTTPGTVFDPVRGLCVPPNQLTQQPEEFSDFLSSLKTVPWWAWGALAALLLLSRNKEEGRTTTVKYRRAS